MDRKKLLSCLLGGTMLVCAVVVLPGCGRKITEEERAQAFAYVQQGVAAAESGQLDVATDLFKRAIVLDSTNAEAHYRLAMMLQYAPTPDLQEAEAEYRRAIAHDSSQVAAMFNLGQLCAQTSRYDEALSLFEKVLERDTTAQIRSLTHFCIGMTYGIRGDADRAARAYAEAVHADSSYARAYVGWGKELARTQRYEEAARLLEKALTLDSSLIEAHSHLATCYRGMNRMDAAAAQDRFYQQARAGNR